MSAPVHKAFKGKSFLINDITVYHRPSKKRKIMPKFYEDIEETKKKKKHACEDLRDDLLECLSNTDCVRKDRKTPRECMHDASIPNHCNMLRNAFFECKRSLLDMRTRFRGRKYY
ncbi:Dephospho-CoA kinase (Dephosphocoenzyme A kinase) (COAE) [Bulinus truncatus]|nr:Dephospho-CoA kinase (Dephosphocoenzyme A kinase) (COAE) [Bulinus truncatus]